jgi:hypothetical protein
MKRCDCYLSGGCLCSLFTSGDSNTWQARLSKSTAPETARVQTARVLRDSVGYTYTDFNGTFLGAFAILRKPLMSFAMSVYPSACNNSAPIGRLSMKFDIFRNSDEKIQT